MAKSEITLADLDDLDQVFRDARKAERSRYPSSDDRRLYDLYSFGFRLLGENRCPFRRQWLIENQATVRLFGVPCRFPPPGPLPESWSDAGDEIVTTEAEK